MGEGTRIAEAMRKGRRDEGRGGRRRKGVGALRREGAGRRGGRGAHWHACAASPS